LSNNLSSETIPHALPPIVGRALLVSNEPTVVVQLTNGMQQFAIAVDVCPDLLTAVGFINTRKFEVIVVDFGLGDQAVHIFERIRLSPSNGNSVTFAIMDSRSREDLEIQPTFVLSKPLTEALLGSVLKPALGLIIRDYRRYFRCPVTIPVLLRIDGKAQIPCEMINISEGGLAVKTSATFNPGS
jgi:PilZ domain-containing protein